MLFFTHSCVAFVSVELLDSPKRAAVLATPQQRQHGDTELVNELIARTAAHSALPLSRDFQECIYHVLYAKAKNMVQHELAKERSKEMLQVRRARNHLLLFGANLCSFFPATVDGRCQRAPTNGSATQR